MEDLSEIINDSITDVTLPTPEVDLDTPSDVLEAVPEVTETSEVAPDPVDPAPVLQDDFDKKFGLTAQSSSGRENRIPYSRLKKITAKAINDAKTSWQKDLEASHVPSAKFAELDTKVKDYEARLGQVAEFEKVMTTDHTRFLNMLYTIPGYKQLFDKIAGSAQAQPDQEPVQISEDMPQPDQELSDGSKVYSLDGLKGLLAWQDSKTAKRTVEQVMKQVEARYAPIERDYQSFQKVQAIKPQVDRQIADARTWPLFNENEDEIVKALQTYPAYSLERAYQAVVFPKMKADQDKFANEAKVTKETMRTEILKELKQAPRSTSAVSGPTRPAPQAATGPRSLEDVIADSIKGLK